MKRFIIFQFIPSISILLIFGFLVSCGSPTTQNSSQSTSRNEIVTWDWFSEQDSGIEFKYPAFLSISSERDYTSFSGELITSDLIEGRSKEPYIYLMIGTIEDPSHYVQFPGNYPPDEFLFQLTIGRRLNDVRGDTSYKTDSDTILHTLDNLNITKISGHHAALYQAELEGTVKGKVYVRGAEIVTEDRFISIVMLGEDSLEPELFDEFWEGFIDSLSINY